MFVCFFKRRRLKQNDVELENKATNKKDQENMNPK